MVRVFLRKTAFALFFAGIATMFASQAFAATPTYGDINGSSGGQGLIFAEICTQPGAACPCRDSGDCTLNDILQVFANLATFVLGISGSAVLFMFIYGGFSWVFSHGDGKWVERGKDTMIGATIGLAIIFGSYVALNFIVSGLTTKPGETPSSGNLESTIKDTGASSGIFTTE